MSFSFDEDLKDRIPARIRLGEWRFVATARLNIFMLCC